MRFLFTCLASVPFYFSSACAQDVPPEQTNGLADYLIGNAYHILLHEIGHMLIDVLDLPVLGQEEDAADNYATLTMLDWDNEYSDGAIADAAHAWFARHDDEGIADDLSIFFDEHDLDAQRASRLICHLIGVDPEAYKDLAEDMELDREENENCEFTYEETARSWERQLEPFAPKSGHANKLTIKYGDPKPGQEFYARILKEGKVLERVASHLNGQAALPSGVTFESRSCDDANAWYDPESRTISLCYELLEDIAELYEPFEETED